MSRGRGQGKIILVGEHAVVYGVPALAAPLPSCVEVIAMPGAGSLRLGGQTFHVGDGTGLGEALECLIATRGGAPRTDLEAELGVPSGAGLGSSAALGVAIARALDAHEGRTRSREDLHSIVQAWEGVFHGRPSGIDAAMAMGAEVSVFEQGRLRPAFVREPLPLVIAVSGEVGSTRAMVDRVADRARTEGDFDERLDRFRERTRAAEDALARGALETLGVLFTEAHQDLASLGVSTSRLDHLVGEALDAGALGAKLTGGGGGGSVIALARTPADAERIAARLRAGGRLAFASHVSASCPSPEGSPQP